MSRERVRGLALTGGAMIAFASNSLLCRLALREHDIDASSFTALRLGAGALLLTILVRPRAGGDARSTASWASALALFAYASAFSFAYVRLDAGVGALVLFGAVQLTMVSGGIARGQRLRVRQALGLGIAIAGLVLLARPSRDAPDALGIVLMLAAGVAWGVYSLRGAGALAPSVATRQNFVRSVPFALLLALGSLDRMHVSGRGAALAIASGGLASGLGYVVWYGALRHLRAIEAALVQLAVPVLAALAATLVLNEALTPRTLLAGAAILCGIAIGVAPQRAP